MGDYYERFSEKDKIRLLNERDKEIFEQEKKFESLIEEIDKLKAEIKKAKQISKVVKLKPSRLDTEGIVYSSKLLETHCYMTEYDDFDGTEIDYYDLLHTNIASDLYRDSDFHIVEDVKVKVHLEVFRNL